MRLMFPGLAIIALGALLGYLSAPEHREAAVASSLATADINHPSVELLKQYPRIEQEELE